MAGPKVPSSPKYEPVGDGYGTKSSPIYERRDGSYEEVVGFRGIYAYAKTYRRSLVICIGLCLSCLIFSVFVLGATGVLLSIITRKISLHDTISPNDPPALQTKLSLEADTEPYHCGSSPSDALARGCTFDIMTTSWQHPDCYDAELNAEITALHGPWKFYWSSGPPDVRPQDDMLHVIPTEELGFHQGLFWATREYHVWHCTYAWRSMHRALERGRKIDKFLSDYEHTAHCARLLVNASDPLGLPMDSAVTRATVKYPLC